MFKLYVSFPFSLLSFYLDNVVLLKGIILICFLVDGFRCSLKGTITNDGATILKLL